MGKIRSFGLVAALLSGLIVTGCSFPGIACPAIGWDNTVTIHLDGDAGAVAVIEVCEDGACSSSASVQQASNEPLQQLSTLTPAELSTPSASSAVPFPFFISRVDDSSWTVSVGMTTPDVLTIRALSSDGELLAEREVSLDWQRVGGSEQCGGPGEAGPVRLTISS